MAIHLPITNLTLNTQLSTPRYPELEQFSRQLSSLQNRTTFVPSLEFFSRRIPAFDRHFHPSPSTVSYDERLLTVLLLFNPIWELTARAVDCFARKFTFVSKVKTAISFSSATAITILTYANLPIGFMAIGILFLGLLLDAIMRDPPSNPGSSSGRITPFLTSGPGQSTFMPSSSSLGISSFSHQPLTLLGRTHYDSSFSTERSPSFPSTFGKVSGNFSFPRYQPSFPTFQKNPDFRRSLLLKFEETMKIIYQMDSPPERPFPFWQTIGVTPIVIQINPRTTLFIDPAVVAEIFRRASSDQKWAFQAQLTQLISKNKGYIKAYLREAERRKLPPDKIDYLRVFLMENCHFIRKSQANTLTAI